ncbi:MAG: hypothetical protein ABR985_22505 [Methanotrichaceae archaeon]|jgi:hypothetical protein
MNAKERSELLEKTGSATPSPIDVLGYDGREAKKDFESTHWNDKKVHPKSCFGDDQK